MENDKEKTAESFANDMDQLKKEMEKRKERRLAKQFTVLFLVIAPTLFLPGVFESNTTGLIVVLVLCYIVAFRIYKMIDKL